MDPTPLGDAGRKALEEAGQEFARFLGRVFGPAMDEVGEALRYHAAAWKLKNAISVKDKVERILVEAGVEKTHEVSKRLGLPLLEAASNEDDEVLQDVWAGLLASAMTSSDLPGVRKSFVEITKQLDPIDALILRDIYRRWLEQRARRSYKISMVKCELDRYIQFWMTLEKLRSLNIFSTSLGNRMSDEEFDWITLLPHTPDEKHQYNVHGKFTTLGVLFTRAVAGDKLLTEDGGEDLFFDVPPYKTRRSDNT